MDQRAVIAEEPIEEAVRAFQAGRDRERCFREVVDGYYGPLRSFFERRVSSAEDGLELTQETFLRIYSGLAGFRHETRFRSWVFGIAHTTYLKWLEKRRRVEDGANLPEPAGETSGWERGEAVPVVAGTALDGLLAREAREKLAAAVAELPKMERQCVMLRVYQDLPYQEVADLLGIELGTVKAHLNHARQKLKSNLQTLFARIEF